MKKNSVLLILILMMLVGVLTGCDSEQNKSFRKMEDFEQARIGILTGSSFDLLAKEYFPEAEKCYYMNVADLILNLKQEKIDGVLIDKGFFTPLRWEDDTLAFVEMDMPVTEYAVAFPKTAQSEPLKAQMDEFIRNRTADGWLEELSSKWFADSEPDGNFDLSLLTGKNGSLRVATTAESKPFDYLQAGTYCGFDAEFIYQFAKEYGYALEIDIIDFGALLPGLQAGRYDLAISSITVTEERKESVLFSEIYCNCPVVMTVTNESAVTEANSTALSEFWKETKEDFQKTFIREERWKLIAEGVGVTLLISICAMAAGTVFGFGLYMAGRSDVKAIRMLIRGSAKVYSRMIAGTPVVVILMILFYVVFGKFRDMSGIVVAIIGFTLTFGAFVYDHMTVAVGSVDRGQTEAAYALGYNKNKAFFRIVFPQAMNIFLPSYCGQAVELIKATAVVGYVAVNDLTKMGDIIRSNTYEAFFPLIATAVIYFLLTWLLSILLGFVKLRFEPKRRSREAVLKGVKTV